MNTKRLFSLLLSCLLVVSCLAMPAGAVATSAPEMGTVITRATGQFDESIPEKTILTLADVLLNRGEIVTYDCSYTPKSANVEFGYIGPDGLFYGLGGSNGYINKGIRVSEPGSYTLAIWNLSNTAVSVRGTVNY